MIVSDSLVANREPFDISVGLTRRANVSRFSAPQAPTDMSDNSGPFRRTLTKSGLFAISVTFRLPVSGDIFPNSLLLSHPEYKDTCYVYLGGWPGNRSQDDSAIDFGLQFSAARRVWDIVALCSRIGYKSDGKKIPAFPRSWAASIPAGHTVSISFYLSPETVAQGTSSQPTTKILGIVSDLSYSIPLKQIITFPVSFLSNWNIAGDNQYLKSMVSIGQGAGLEGARPTFFNHVHSDPGVVYHAVKRNGSYQVIPGSGAITPEYDRPRWDLGTSSLGALYGYYMHPSATDVRWPRSGVIRAAPDSSSTGNPFVKQYGGAPETVSIACNGGAP